MKKSTLTNAQIAKIEDLRSEGRSWDFISANVDMSIPTVKRHMERLFRAHTKAKEAADLLETKRQLADAKRQLADEIAQAKAAAPHALPYKRGKLVW
jgi:DNA-binding transcriptional ArsR family regulator